MSWVLQSNKSRDFDFSLLFSLTIDRSACIGKLLIAEAIFVKIEVYKVHYQSKEITIFLFIPVSVDS